MCVGVCVRACVRVCACVCAGVCTRVGLNRPGIHIFCTKNVKKYFRAGVKKFFDQKPLHTRRGFKKVSIHTRRKKYI